jgi:signal transduction histidine kinase
MKKPLLFKKLSDIPITRKLYFTVGIMAFLVIVELITLWFAIHTLSSVRAFVGAEGLWSKAQKDAVYHLNKYITGRKESDYIAFKNFMSVPLGDHKTRIELLKPNPDLEIARQGFIEGRIHPDDIDGMLQLFQRFSHISYINKAFGIWSRGDTLIANLIPLGEAAHREIRSGNPDERVLQLLADAIDPLNQSLTSLEDEFSYTLGEGSRWLENTILKLLFLVALTVEITGLLITISVSRSITRGLGEINQATKKITKGDLKARATVLSGDEIGQVATAVNTMTEQLVNSNKELEHFAYIASHDLQEPLRSISNYAKLFDEEYHDKLDDNAKLYLSSIKRSTARMQLLIKDMLDYSRIGHEKVIKPIDCNVLINNIITDLKGSLTESNAEIKTDRLPVINGYSEIKLVFQNLISNAIKFRKKDEHARVFVKVTNDKDSWLFAVTDNGIGIEKDYFERIFIIFQRLHTRKEYPGTGIGLAHCRKIIELHGGRIWVDSEPEKGSTFYFTVPKLNAHES